MEELREVYDDATVARLDAWTPTGASRAPRRAGPVAGGLVLTALALGIRDVLEPKQRDPVVEEIDLAALVDGRQPVSILFVPGEPARSVAIVRPWLLRAAS